MDDIIIGIQTTSTRQVTRKGGLRSTGDTEVLSEPKNMS